MDGVFHFTFARHPVPVWSLLKVGLGPDDNVCRESGERSEMVLGFTFQTRFAARQMAERALHYQTRTSRCGRTSNTRWKEVKLTLFLYM